jgi:predicted acylesterase/phospholipase RssA
MQNTQVRIGLALSGGGFRATLFHLGVVRMLYEARLLKSVRRIGAVSGGSVLAAHLVLYWDAYTNYDNKQTFDDVAQELIRFVQRDIRGRVVRRWILGLTTLLPRLLLPRRKRWTFTNLLQKYYAHLFRNATLKDLRGSERPEIFINCTSLFCRCPNCRKRHRP